MIKFNTVKFLQMPLNDNNSYISDDGSGCVKGNFFRCVENKEELGDFTKLAELLFLATNQEFMDITEGFLAAAALQSKHGTAPKLIREVLTHFENMLWANAAGNTDAKDALKLQVVNSLIHYKLVEEVELVCVS